MKHGTKRSDQGWTGQHASPPLVLHKVAKTLGNTPLFSGVSLSLSAGETLAIVGESGSGKSTLLHLMAGLDHAGEGEIHWGQQAIAHMNEPALAGLRLRHVGLVFQAYYLMPHLNALNNVQLPFLLAGQRPDTARCTALLEQVGLAHKHASYPREMSGGEQQRVAIARALALNPPLILADEPTGNLDEDNAGRVLDTLVSCCRQSGNALVMVTHSERAASRLDKRLDLGQHRVQQHPPVKQ